MAPDRIDALFQLPPAEFTAARNALITALKKEGDGQTAEHVKHLPRPSVSAWVANQMYWRHRKAFDKLITAGEQFRKAQAAQLAGKSADLRAPLDARRAALGDLMKIAGELLHDAGHPHSPDTMRRVMTTLEALATTGSIPGARRPGRLTTDVDPPGFEALAALVPRDSAGRRAAPRRRGSFRSTSQRRPPPKGGKPRSRKRRRAGSSPRNRANERPSQERAPGRRTRHCRGAKRDAEQGARTG